MTVRELQDYLNSFEPTATVYIANDEELNNIYDRPEVGVLGDDDDNNVIIWPSGELVDEEML